MMSTSKGIIAESLIEPFPIVAVLHKLHDDGRKRCLAQRSSSHHRIRRDHQASLSIALAVGLEIADLAVVKDCDTNTCDVGCLHELSYAGVDFGWRQTAAVEPQNGLRGRRLLTWRRHKSK